MLSDRIKPKLSLPESTVQRTGRYRPVKRKVDLFTSPVPIKYEVEIVQDIINSSEEMYPGRVYSIYQTVSRLNNDLLVPMGYYFGFDIDGVDLDFSVDEYTTYHLERVKSVRYFFGISSPKKKKDIILPYSLMKPNVSIRVLNTDRKEDHSFTDRGSYFDSYETLPRGMYQQQQSDLLAVPKRMKATARQKATSKYVFKKNKSYPIGDLYHARKAIDMVLWPSNKANRSSVLKAVVKAYPKYDWKSYWEYKRSRAKNKAGIQSYDSLI